MEIIINDNISIVIKIENRVTAEQNALASKNKLEQVKFEAEQKIESAKAEAESLRLQKQEITPEMSNWIKKKGFSQTGIFNEAIKELGFKEVTE